MQYVAYIYSFLRDFCADSNSFNTIVYVKWKSKNWNRRCAPKRMRTSNTYTQVFVANTDAFDTSTATPLCWIRCLRQTCPFQFVCILTSKMPKKTKCSHADLTSHLHVMVMLCVKRNRYYAAVRVMFQVFVLLTRQSYEKRHSMTLCMCAVPCVCTWKRTTHNWIKQIRRRNDSEPLTLSNHFCVV